MQTILCRDITEAELRELHAMSNELLAEDLAHFRVHAGANDLVHIFRDADSGKIVGFQFWQTAPIRLPASRVILGGKLRIRPEFRNRGLHLLSGLMFYLQNKIRSPWTRYYRLSIASLFGFVSITEALARYKVFDPRAEGREAEAVGEAFTALAEESHFHLDLETGLFLVNIFMTPLTLDRYPPRYFDKPAARVYASKNPKYRENGSFVGFWFLFSPDNLLSMMSVIRRKLLRRA